jgi:hypothetical protein
VGLGSDVGLGWGAVAMREAAVEAAASSLDRMSTTAVDADDGEQGAV